jgi:hypothetical protein
MAAQETALTAALTTTDIEVFFSNPVTHSLQAAVKDARVREHATREKVDAYKLAAFAAWDFFDEDTGERISDPSDLYLTDDSDETEAKCADWYAHCDTLHAANGFEVQPGRCPALVAKSELIDAENALLAHAGEMLHLAEVARVTGDLRERALALYMSA